VALSCSFEVATKEHDIAFLEKKLDFKKMIMI